jgi:hypothetical protein
MTTSDPRYVETLKGRGNYKRLLRRLGKNTISTAGAALGGVAGASFGPAGASFGASSGKIIGDELGSVILGQGDYAVLSNSIASTGGIIPEGQDIPLFSGARFGTRIKHKEFIRDIIAPDNPTEFNNTSFDINPGNSQLFPWLASVARAYQQFEINGMVIYFKTTTSDYAAGGALGTVVLATVYDVAEEKFKTKVSMENTQYSVSAKPSRSQVHAIECDPSQRVTKLAYVRNSAFVAASLNDNRFYDIGKFQIATTGLAATPGQVLGELWVSYDITLHKPDLNDQSVGEAIIYPTGTGVTKDNWFGKNEFALWGIKYAIPVEETNRLQFNTTGKFLLNLDLAGSTIVNPTITVPSGTASLIAGSVNNSSGTATYIYQIDVPVPNTEVNIDFSSTGSVTRSFTALSPYDAT